MPARINVHFTPRTSRLRVYLATNCISHKSSNLKSSKQRVGQASADVSLSRACGARGCLLTRKKESSPGRSLSVERSRPYAKLHTAKLRIVPFRRARDSLLSLKSVFPTSRQGRTREGERNVETRFVINQISARIGSHPAAGRQIRRVRIINLADRIAVRRGLIFRNVTSSTFIIRR